MSKFYQSQIYRMNTAFGNVGRMGDSLLTLRMEVNSTDCPRNLIKADVIETFETCATYRPHPVIWDQEVFFPPHEYVIPLR